MEEFSGDLEIEKIERIRAKISTLKSKLEEDRILMKRFCSRERDEKILSVRERRKDLRHEK